MIVTLLLLGSAALAQESQDGDFGPKLGEKVPAFELSDQSGQKQNLKTLSGPNGLLILFHRSADW